MFEPFLWGAVGASALLVGALLAYVTKPSPKLLAVVMALGAGLLIGSISFELIDEALGPEQPAGVPDRNWIQTMPGKGWFIVLRLYSPLAPFFDKSWRVGEVEPAR